METDTAVGVGALSAILKIAFYRATDSRQLAADLMMPSGLKVDFQKCIMITFDERFVV